MINNYDKINIGLQLLRMISSLWVVTNHCYFSKYNKHIHYYLHQKPFHVPNFMFLSFYFFYNHLSERNINKIIQRFKRLLIPYLIWPFIFLIINNICFKMFGWGNYRCSLAIKDYLIQIIIGKKYSSHFWYLCVVLFFSLFFAIISFINPKYFLFIIQLVGFFVYRIHRSKIYSYLKEKNLFKISLVLAIRFFPIAVFGLTFGSFKLIFKLKKFYIRTIIINIITIYFLFKYNIFTFDDIYIYQDVDTITIGSINFFTLFGLIPFYNFNNAKFISILKYITNYTGGIYYLHTFILFFLDKIFKSVRKRTFFGVFIIYINVYFLCFIGHKILKNSKMKYLFI